MSARGRWRDPESGEHAAPEKLPGAEHFLPDVLASQLRENAATHLGQTLEETDLIDAMVVAVAVTSPEAQERVTATFNTLHEAVVVAKVITFAMRLTGGGAEIGYRKAAGDGEIPAGWYVIVGGELHALGDADPAAVRRYCHGLGHELVTDSDARWN